MFSQRLCAAFISLAWSSFIVEAAPAQSQCNASTTVIKTVFVTARAPSTTAALAASIVTTRSTTTPTPGVVATTRGNIGNTHAGTTTRATTTSRSTTTARAVTTDRSTTARTTTARASTTARATTTARTTTAPAVTTTSRATTTTRANNGGNTNTKTTSAASATSSAIAGGNTGGNPQTSLTLDPRVIASGFANDGQDVPAVGQIKSLTSTNNFINFCLTVNSPITDGKQIQTGSCNPTPIGVIPSIDNMPSSKFVFPPNFGTVKANTAFTIKMAIKNMQTGFFTNAEANYFAAPQQLNGQGQIQGHSHVVIEQLTSLTQTSPTDPKKFAFFKGLNAAAAGGQLTADVTAGLPVGTYKLASINSASNHQPVIVPVAQHGSLDDAIYFSVTANGQAAAGNIVAPTNSSSASASATTSTSVSVTANSSVEATASATVSGSASVVTTTGQATATASSGASKTASEKASITTAAPTIATTKAATTTTPITAKETAGGNTQKGVTASTSSKASSSIASPSATATPSKTGNKKA